MAQLAASAAQLTAPQDYAQIVVDLAQRRSLASILEETLAETRAFDIGRNAGDKHRYLATGDSGQGITNGVMASLLISNLIVDGSRPRCR